MIKPITTLAAAIAAVTLAGCDVQPQDATGEDSRQGMNGLAVDGRVAGGKVWVDRNNNNRIDDFEPYAYTDSDGYYSYNPLNNVNYCGLPIISDEYQRYCLIYGSSIDDVVIRIKGGTDLSTGERLKGVMSMGSTISDSSSRSSTPLVLSPITTLLQGANSESDRTSIRSALGITSDADLRLDFSLANDVKSKKFLANSIAVQTMMDVLASSTEVTDTETTQVNLINSIASQVAKQSTAPTSLPSTNLTQIAQVVSTNTTTQTNVASRLALLNAEIKKIETAANSTAVTAQIKASEVVSQLVKKEVSNIDTDAVKKVLDSGIVNLSTSLVTSMNDDTVEFDIATITNTLVDAGKTAVTNDEDFDNTSVSTAVNDSKLATGTVWGGKWFVMKATAEDSDDLAEGSYIAIYLAGTADSTSGSIGTCVNVSPSVDEGETADPEEVFENEYIGGRWSKISSGMVTLTFNYEGQEFEGTMKAKAFEEGNPQLYRFSSDIDGATEQGDLELDVNAVSALANVGKPGSASDCAQKVDTQI